MQLQSARSHTVVHAVPLPADLFAKAPMYFKAEVDSAAGEWSQHHAKRMIDTRDKVCVGPTQSVWGPDSGLHGILSCVAPEATRASCWLASYVQSLRDLLDLCLCVL